MRRQRIWAKCVALTRSVAEIVLCSSRRCRSSPARHRLRARRHSVFHARAGPDWRRLLLVQAPAQSRARLCDRSEPLGDTTSCIAIAHALCRSADRACTNDGRSRCAGGLEHRLACFDCFRTRRLCASLWWAQLAHCAIQRLTTAFWQGRIRDSTQLRRRTQLRRCAGRALAAICGLRPPSRDVQAFRALPTASSRPHRFRSV